MHQLQDDTAKDPELRVLLQEKRAGTMSKTVEWDPRMWNEIRERDGVLLKGKQIIVPKLLQPQAITLALEGHMQADGTLRHLRET